MEYMYIVWAVVIAVALVVEYFTLDFSAVCLGFAAIPMLILNAFDVELTWQIIIYVVLSVVLLVFIRPLCKKFFDKSNIPTNADANVGKVVKLLDDIANGRSTIKLNDVIFSVVCDGDGKKGDSVKITGMDGNKFLVKTVEKGGK
jgi:membrane protein implicated in regulation of membrane protease activity